MTWKQYVTLQNPQDVSKQKMNLGFLSQIIQEIFFELRPEFKVTVTQKQYPTLCDPKMYPDTKFGIPLSNDIGGMLKTEARGQGHSDLKNSM